LLGWSRHFAAMTENLENKRYCFEMVRRDDHERYLTSLFASKVAQRAVWAVLAFNQEVAKIRDNITETALGEIRLQWWQEVLVEIQKGTIRQQPVIQELAAIEGSKKIWILLEESLEARSLEMTADAPTSLLSLQQYTNGVGGALHEAILHVCAKSPVSAEAILAARSAGTAWAMMGLIRALPFHWQAGRSMLPQDNDLAMQIRNAAKAFEALEPTILEMRAFVEAQLVYVRKNFKSVPREARPSVLCVPLIKQHLRVLEKAGNNPFETPPFAVSDLRKISSLVWHIVKGRF